MCQEQVTHGSSWVWVTHESTELEWQVVLEWVTRNEVIIYDNVLQYHLFQWYSNQKEHVNDILKTYKKVIYRLYKLHYIYTNESINSQRTGSHISNTPELYFKLFLDSVS